MKLRTTFQIPPLAPIDHRTHIWGVGSCFATTIGEYLQDQKFDIQLNPFGVIFNPISICKLISTLSYDETSLYRFLEEGIVQSGELFYHEQLHSQMVSDSREALLQSLVQLWASLKSSWDRCDYLILTFGTAWVYQNQSGEIVANCHKLPQNSFQKRLLTIDEILDASQSLPKDKKILLTVSPVRHIKDSIPLNTLSKSTLLLAVHQLTQQDHMQYFASFELMMDDLRDYRFYGDDLLHPSTQAKAYICEQFCRASMDDQTLDLIHRWTKIKKSLSHRAFFPQSQSHQKFLKHLLKDLQALSQHLPVMDEIQQVQAQIL